MTRALIRWYRTVLPGWTVPAFIALLVAFELPYILAVSMTDFAVDISLLRKVLIQRDALLIACAVVYGYYRIAAFHPVFRRKYWDWLSHTPWTADKPLPLGPVHLVWQDLMIVGILIVVPHERQLDLHAVPLAFMFSYLATLAVCFHRVGFNWAAYAIAFGEGLVIRLWYTPWAAVAAAAMICLVAQVVLPHSLEAMRWSYVSKKIKRVPAHFPTSREELYLGWPFQLLHPQADEPESRLDLVAIPILAAWLLYAGLALDRSGIAWMIAAAFGLSSALGAACLRFGLYCWNYHPPINIWRRIATLRLIVPGYDKVFMAPLAMMVIVAFTGDWLTLAGGSGTIIVPVILGVQLLLLLNMPPSFESWRLTGHHRIRPMASQEAVKL